MLTDAGLAAVNTHLDHALAALEEALESDRSDRESPSAAASTDPALVRAVGGVLAIIGTVLARSDVVPLGELARLFELYAAISTDDDPDVGTIVEAWSSMIANAAGQGT